MIVTWSGVASNRNSSIPITGVTDSTINSFFHTLSIQLVLYSCWSNVSVTWVRWVIVCLCTLFGRLLAQDTSSNPTMISNICLILYIPNKKININDFKFNKIILKDILHISLPSTGSRLIGSISYFFEPIILTFILLYIGYDSNYITHEYGIITGYVYPLLLLPSFFFHNIIIPN